MPTFDRTKFWTGYRQAFGKATQKTVDAIEFLLDGFTLSSKWRNIKHCAYALATIKHETANTYLPIFEYGPKSYFNKYNAGTPIGKRLGNTQPGDGYRFRGAGLVQITGRANFAKFGIDDTPELALEPSTAFRILTEGMHSGLFTGKKLSDYINASKTDYRNARRIINGTDKAALIEGYAKQFEKILTSSRLSEPQIVPATDTATTSSPAKDEIQHEAPTVTPTETTEIVQTTTDTGTEATSVTVKNEQDVNEPAQVSTTNYQGVGFIGALKKDFAVVGGGNLSFQGIQEYATQASGWPPWLISLITKLATIVAVAGVAWLLFRLGHYLVWKIGDWQRMKVEANINSDVKRKNIEFT